MIAISPVSVHSFRLRHKDTEVKPPKEPIGPLSFSGVQNVYAKHPVPLNAAAFGVVFKGGVAKEHDVFNNFDGLTLRTLRYYESLQKIQTLADKKIEGQDRHLNNLNPKSTIWSLSSEFGVIKEGGLAVVPDHVQRNLAKLKVDLPTFIPMYINDGVSSLNEENGIYKWGKTEFPVQKVASTEVDSYREGKTVPEEVQLWAHKQKDGSMLYFLRNDNYFKGGIYKDNETAGEKEKFAFFSRVMYDIAKLKMDPTHAKGTKVYNKQALNELKAPDGILLNDWQVAATAGVMRYVSTLEEGSGEIDKDTAQKMADMKIVLIGHNAQYQGNTWSKGSMENILNTLYGKYTDDVVKNSRVSLGSHDLSFVDVLGTGKHDKNVNLLNMGLATCDYFCPVSPNYAKELIQDPEKSKWLQGILEKRQNAGTMVGVLNGNDRASIDSNEQGSVFAMLKNANPEFRPYSHKTSKEDFMEIKAHNKALMLQETLKNFLKNPGSALVVEDGTRKTDYPTVDPYKTPVYSFVGRGSSQKGLDVLAKSVTNTLNTWEQDFPDKEKPLFIISALDSGEKDRMLDILSNLKRNLKDEDYNRVMVFYGQWPGFKVAQAYADFSLIPSMFEPCGLVQSEEQALGVIPVTSRTGGFVNTIYDPEIDPQNVNKHKGQTGYIAQNHTNDPEQNAHDFTRLIKRTANDYFSDKNKVDDISYNALQLDHSWIRPDGKGGVGGPIFDYLRLFGFSEEDIQSITKEKP